jgi:hypothetical protein
MEPLWWVGMITSKVSSCDFSTESRRDAFIRVSMGDSEQAFSSFLSDCGRGSQFRRYAFARAVLVTPLGALSIIVR